MNLVFIETKYSASAMGYTIYMDSFRFFKVNW